MSEEVSNHQILGLLVDMNGKLGALVSQSEAHLAWQLQHTRDDALMAADIKKLQLSSARQRGVLAALTSVGAILGALAGYAVDLLTLRGHR
jgi:hypothetical protein